MIPTIIFLYLIVFNMVFLFSNCQLSAQLITPSHFSFEGGICISVWNFYYQEIKVIIIFGMNVTCVFFLVVSKVSLFSCIL